MKKKVPDNKNSDLLSVVHSFADILKEVIDAIVYLYIAIMILILPFYFTEGFKRIGSDKAEFFRQKSLGVGKILLPFVFVYFLVTMVLFFVDTYNELEEEAKKTDKKISELKYLWSSFLKKINLSTTDKFALLYVVALVLSFIFSNYRGNTIWGANGWYMGFCTQLILLGSYYMISRIKIDIRYAFLMIFPASTVVFMLEIFNRFNYFPIDMIVNDNISFVSTIGNINWYCGYMVAVMFAGFYILWKLDDDCVFDDGLKIFSGEQKYKIIKISISLYMVVAFISILTQGSMSGILALMGVLIFAFVLSGRNIKRHVAFWYTMSLLSFSGVILVFLRKALKLEYNYEIDSLFDFLTGSYLYIVAFIVCVVIYISLLIASKKSESTCYEKIGKILGVFSIIVGIGTVVAFVLVVMCIALNTAKPGSLGSLSEIGFFTFNPRWGSYRGAIWKASLMCFGEQDFLHKLVGVGPDAMAEFIYNGGSVGLKELVNNSFNSLRLTNSHNEWLTILVNLGLAGFVAYVGFVMTQIKELCMMLKKKENCHINQIIVGACYTCVLAHTVNCMVSFQTSINMPIIFVIMGIGECLRRQNISKKVN